jgi:hypothetical protein
MTIAPSPDRFSAAPQRAEKDERRWRPAQTYAFAIGSSVAGWVAIGLVVVTLLKR